MGSRSTRPTELGIVQIPQIPNAIIHCQSVQQQVHTAVHISTTNNDGTTLQLLKYNVYSG